MDDEQRIKSLVKKKKRLSVTQMYVYCVAQETLSLWQRNVKMTASKTKTYAVTF